jgi:hypothetical protein
MGVSIKKEVSCTKGERGEGRRRGVIVVVSQVLMGAFEVENIELITGSAYNPLCASGVKILGCRYNKLGTLSKLPLSPPSFLLAVLHTFQKH